MVPRGTVRYQWFRGTKAIAGRTAATYKVTRTDRGKLLSLRNTTPRSGYAPKALTPNAARPRGARAGGRHRGARQDRGWSPEAIGSAIRQGGP